MSIFRHGRQIRHDKQAGQSREGRLNSAAKFSAVSAGLDCLSNLFPGLRPGLVSAVPSGLN